MRIAQVAPLYESVPPKLYGGTERIVSHLTEALVRQGHDVTLYASGDSQTSARLVPMAASALRLHKNGNGSDPFALHFRILEYLQKTIHEFDVVHCHVDYMHLPNCREQVPCLNTLHGRLDVPELLHLYREFDGIPVVSISNSQRTPLWWINWQATVYHGLAPELYKLQESPREYLAFLGRI